MSKSVKTDIESKRVTQLSNSFSTGGGGVHFEAHVQASFVTLMLTGGYAPCMPSWAIKEIKLQGKIDGFETDDLIVYVEHPGNKERRKILGQVKHAIHITANDQVFSNVICAAWSDFNNPKLFTKNIDIIALITGSLSATDTEDVRWLLDQARHTKTKEEFFRHIEQTHFSSSQKRKKLAAFKAQLKNANRGKDVTGEEFYSFLNNFHLIGYDLGTEDGVVLSLLHSHISQFQSAVAKWVWARIVEIVQTWNQDSGTIIFEKIPEDLKEAFQPRSYEVIPTEFSEPTLELVKPDWNYNALAPELLIANFLGAWDEKSLADQEVISKLADKEYDIWISKIRELHQLPNSPLNLKNGKWCIPDRKELWKALGSRVYDDFLDRFEKCITSVLTEHDPKFDLPAEDRFSAKIYGKILKNSPDLRKGLAEGLALLGNMFEYLTSCSQYKPEMIAVLAVRKIFENSDWIIWGSLDNLLPIIAESAPSEFLNTVEKALSLSSSPFDELFSQEGDSIIGSNYITGLLWALETLAWDQKYLIQVCVLLGNLSSHDPGGKWANRPAQSLTTILLPWLPQTTAPIDKRKIVLQTLQKEAPQVAWKLLITLLPNQHQVSMGSRKPTFRVIIPDNLGKSVNQAEYWDQVNFCAEMSVSMAEQDINKLKELIDHLDKLPQPSIEKVLVILSSEAIINNPEDVRLPLWNSLLELIRKHRQYQDAKWALNSNIISKIEIVAGMIAPINPLNLNVRLFCGRDYDLYDEKGNWEEQSQKLEKKRQEAVKEILDYGGLESIILFAKSVEAPSQVGFSLGFIAEAETEEIILPSLLVSENKKLEQFTSGFVWSKYIQYNWSWVDDVNKSNWTIAQLSQFLCNLPFKEEAWSRATKWLCESESEYWDKILVNPYQVEEDLRFAINKLTEYGRPRAAIKCLFRMVHDNNLIDKAQCTDVLLKAVSSTESSNGIDAYEIVEIIKALQNDPGTDQVTLSQVEWAYLPLLDRDDGASPKVLENRLSKDPAFFCELIRFIYRSKKEEKSQNEPKEQSNGNAINAWRLLNEWKTPPGSQLDGTFSVEQFKNWLEDTFRICFESGHLEVAQIHIGQVLTHSPSDSDGLWILRAVANVLNDINAEKMREGFSIAIFNSRKAHIVDPTGKPERELAEQNRHKAEVIENAGFQRLAVTMRNIAESYNRDADRIVSENI